MRIQRAKQVKLLQNCTAKKQATPGQISLAWLLAKKPWIVPIPATTQMSHMLENVGANDIKFSDDELKQFNQELVAICIKGERLPQAVLNFSNIKAPAK